MILLTSGTYVQDELRSELGDIPPAFLPLANRPLYLHQTEIIRKELPDQDIFLSLPDEFQIHKAELERIASLGIKIVRVPLGLTLSSSILFVLNTIGRYDEPTKILHGDTLISPLPDEDNVLLIGHTVDNYDWDESDSGTGVWAGYFAFADTSRLIRELAVRANFADAVRSYSEGVKVQEREVGTWMDLGHLNSYYETRRKKTTERSFNSLTIENGIVEKTGTPPEKILAEGRWFQMLPRELKPLTPAFYGKELSGSTAAYWIEYLPMVPLNELIVYGRNSLPFWARIISLYSQWFDGAAAYGRGVKSSSFAESRQMLTDQKTQDRLATFGISNEFDLDQPLCINGVQVPSVNALADEMIQESARYDAIPGLFHGDICFSNTLYDSRNQRLRFVDPRGPSENSTSLLGDMRYDVAKLTHSFVGFYDLIVAGIHYAEEITPYTYNFSLPTTPMQRQLAELYLNTSIKSLPQNVIRESLAESILLFVSMLPLHADHPERQLGFLLNAYRLYGHFFRKGLDLQCS